MTNQTASSDLGWEPDALISRPVPFPFDYASQVAICPQIAMSAKTTSNTLYSEFLMTCFLNIPKRFALSLVNLCHQYPIIKSFSWCPPRYDAMPTTIQKESLSTGC